MRGYLYGGLVIDLIGQKGPTSKVHLLLLDLVIVVLQVSQLSAQLTRQKLRESVENTNVAVTTSRGREYRAAPTQQDLDHEERGVRREDVELQALDPGGTTADTAPSEDTVDQGTGDSERDTLLSTQPPAPHTDAHIFDAFHSGQIVVADLDLTRTIRQQFRAYRHAPSEPLQSSRELRANIAGQLLRLRLGVNVGQPARRFG
jgi:hypothetical protein